MSQRDRIIVAAVAIVAAVGGGWFLMAKPKRAEMRQLDAQITAKRAELAGAAATAARYRAARDELRRNPQAFREAGKALPNRIAMSELLRTLDKSAGDVGVEMSSLNTAPGSGSTPGISSVDLALEFDGSFLALQRFLGKMQKLVKVSRDRVAAKGRLLALNSVQLGAVGGDESGLKAKVSATAYILQPGALTATPAAPGATGATPAPTTTGAATP